MLINRLFAVLLFIGFFSASLGQTDTFIVNTVRTNLHKRIPGTKVYINFPDEEVEFMKGMPLVFLPLADVTVLENSFANYFDVAAHITKEEFDRMNVSYTDFLEVKLNEYDGKMIFYNGSPEEGSSISFFFGDSSMMVNIEVKYIYQNVREKQKLKTMLLSTFYEKNMEINHMEDAPFTIELPDSSFRFAKYSTNTYLFNETGNASFDLNSEPFFLILSLPDVGTHTMQEMNQNIPSLLQQFGFTPEKIGEDKAVTINGLQGIESGFEFYAHGKKRKILTTIVFKGNGCLILIGVAFFDYDTYLKKYATIASTIKFR